MPVLFHPLLGENAVKTAQTYLDEANAIVPKLSSEEAIEIHAAGGGIFVDVRDSSDIQKTGTIEGALRIPRGFIEFAADPGMGFHNHALQKNADIYLVCGLGGQAALSGKTLIDMGYKSVTNVGGIGAWKEAGGPMEAT
ncbi:rhodanese-like domain-containing protein [uncultured Tateyamaria sp.]|uniref:rhodanese-like domain-containing protein n=1 Tax=uncultured Tateyamaria sp. TaxID=455651 RepID=UPI002636FEFA|nr:rhodanese-like domain-containing protein [uncultured Tateyamaria sp.]